MELHIPKINAEYKDIRTEALYYVPLNASYEVWDLNVTNTSDKVRKLTITGYAEFTNNSNYRTGSGESPVFPVHHQEHSSKKQNPSAHPW
ncbi:MAG: hypothetical protein ACLVCH_06915 [Roseburia inulinivorans]